MFLIAALKVIFGGDLSTVSLQNIGRAFVIAIPICLLVAIGVVIYEHHNSDI